MKAKRAFDVGISAAGLIALAPVLLASAIAIKLDSDGPVIFRQQRIGRGGRPFTIHKLRTMRSDTDGPMVSQEADPRITRVGQFLRRTKVDEVPQLFDVLRGEMSIVGPRPEVDRYVDKWPEGLRDTILSVRPGLTDPVTVRLRNEQQILAAQADPEHYYVTTLLPQKAAGYAQYVGSRSFWGDLAIMARTLGSIAHSGGLT